MISFGGYYYFPASEVQAVEVDCAPAAAQPYLLAVLLKSGQRYRLSYTHQNQRDASRERLVRQIEQELYQQDGLGRLNDRLFLMEDTIKRLDKRQLRIWRQLQKLLNIKEGDGDAKD